MKYKTIDLCAGIGGIRKGFELTGMFETVLSAEIDESACKTYEHLYGVNPKNDLTSEAFKQRAVETEYDVLLAGFPCQTFSRAGQNSASATQQRVQFSSILQILFLAQIPVRYFWKMSKTLSLMTRVKLCDAL